MPYYSTKKFGPISTGHRQWRAHNSHCRFIHGYGRHVQLTFGCMDLDDRNWVMDFGALKWVKGILEENWDHRVLIASDDPELSTLRRMHAEGLIDMNVMDVEKGWGPGIEASCKWVYDNINDAVFTQTAGRVWLTRVEVWEHENNSAIYAPSMGMN